VQVIGVENEVGGAALQMPTDFALAHVLDNMVCGEDGSPMVHQEAGASAVERSNAIPKKHGDNCFPETERVFDAEPERGVSVANRQRAARTPF